MTPPWLRAVNIVMVKLWSAQERLGVTYLHGAVVRAWLNEMYMKVRKLHPRLVKDTRFMWAAI